jgi:malonate transporter and related proteins
VQNEGVLGVLAGFAIIGFVILVGYIVGRLGLLGDHAQFTLGRLVFFVLSPCLLFTVLAEADVHVLFSSRLAVSALAAVAVFVAFAVTALLVFRQRVPETVIGALGSGYVNANNIGIPVAAYVLGDAGYSAPVILVQLLLFAPVSLAILDASTSGHVSTKAVLLGIVRNPLIIGSLLGALISVFDIPMPEVVMEPFALIGAAAVPVVLISFGMSLSGSRLLAPGTERRPVVLASILKVLVMPVIAWLLARFVFGMSSHELFAIVVLAALPSAQNVFNYAQRYERGIIIARDTVLITTVLCIPVLFVVAFLLAS